jgi:hypothetical protein
MTTIVGSKHLHITVSASHITDHQMVGLMGNKLKRLSKEHIHVSYTKALSQNLAGSNE